MKQTSRQNWISIASTWAKQSLDWTTVHHEALTRSSASETDTRTQFLSCDQALIRQDPAAIWILEHPSTESIHHDLEITDWLRRTCVQRSPLPVISSDRGSGQQRPGGFELSPKWSTHSALCWRKLNHNDQKSNLFRDQWVKAQTDLRLVPSTPRNGPQPVPSSNRFMHDIVHRTLGRVGQLSIEPIQFPLTVSGQLQSAQRLSQLEVRPVFRGQRLGYTAIQIASETKTLSFLSTEERALHLVPYYQSLGFRSSGRLVIQLPASPEAIHSRSSET